jgi:hypothetical protein
MKHLGWIALGLAIVACGTLVNQPTAGVAPARTPTPAPASTSAPTQTAAATPRPSGTSDAAPAAEPTLRPGWQAFEGETIALAYPESWDRLRELEKSSNPSVPDATLVIASGAGDVQIGVHCMPVSAFAAAFGRTPGSPSEAGEILWDVMFLHFLDQRRPEDLRYERLETFSLGGLPAIQVSFTSPGFESALGVENPMELEQPAGTYYKILALVMESDGVCYIVATAQTPEARAQDDISAIIQSLRFIR